MTNQRPLTPFELAHFDRESQLGNVPKAEVALWIGTTVRGDLDLDTLREVLAELAASHALLHAVAVADGDGGMRFELLADYQPPLEVQTGAQDEYLRLINSTPDWSTGLFKAHVISDGDVHRVVIVVHHGICDGRSMFPLVGELWERYSAHRAGSPLPVSDSDSVLVDGVDAQLAATVTEAEVDAFLEQLAFIVAAGDPNLVPLQLPFDSDGTADARGRFALHTIELSPEETATVVTAATAHGFSVNSLLSGAALAAVRSELDADAGPVMMLAGHAVDVRAELSPPLPGPTVLNCVGGVPTPVFAAADVDPVELAKMVEVGVRGAVEARFPALILRALVRGIDPVAAGMPVVLPTLGLSNIGRIPAYPVPDELELVRNFVYAKAPGMPPAMTMFTIGDRLTIQVEYDTVEHTHEQLGRVTEAMREQLRRLAGIEAR